MTEHGESPRNCRTWAGLALASCGALLIAAATAAAHAEAKQPNRGPTALPDVAGGYASTHVLVRARPGVSPSANARGEWRFVRAGDAVSTAASAAAMRTARVTAVRTVFGAARDAALASQLGLDRTYRVDVGRGADVVRLAQELAALGALFDYAELDGVGGVADIPNDPNFGQQYALDNTGQVVGGTPGAVGADINGPDAFGLAASLGLDTSDIVIATLDSGLNPHVELAGRILPGLNIPDGTTITTDECSSHGTHVAGIIGATGNNGVGIAGLAWSVRFKPYVVVNPCLGTESSVATALFDATNSQIRLVNMSLQYYTGTTALQDAVTYAAAFDVVMVAATGNNGNTNIAYPAKWPETIAVGATNHLDQRWVSSNFGPEIDLTAPGFTVHSLIDTSSYGNKSGTSMAVPHVTGTIALMLAKNPSLTGAQVRSILEATAHDLGPAGFDVEFGHGRLDAFAALSATPSAAPEDLDGDGEVGPADLAILLGAWGACAGCDGECVADLDGDCAVGPTDLGILLGGWT